MANSSPFASSSCYSTLSSRYSVPYLPPLPTSTITFTCTNNPTSRASTTASACNNPKSKCFTSSFLSLPSSINSTVPKNNHFLATLSSSCLLFSSNKYPEIPTSRLRVSAKSKSNTDKTEAEKQELEVEEVEEEMPWIQDKALDIVEFTGSVTQAIPGPRVGGSSLPWLLAVPLAYLGITFVFAFVKTVKKFSSPREKRRKLVNKNAELCKSIDELFVKGEEAIERSALIGLMQKTGFKMEEILRKYIRYALNEKPFNADLIQNLIKLRKASMLDDSQVGEILNEISKRIVRDKGPVVMDMSGYSEKGFKRKLAVQALFGKVYYLSEMPAFCSPESSLTVKEIFGVADEDAVKLRLHTISESGDLDALQKMIDNSDSKDPDEEKMVDDSDSIDPVKEKVVDDSDSKDPDEESSKDS